MFHGLSQITSEADALRRVLSAPSLVDKPFLHPSSVANPVKWDAVDEWEPMLSTGEQVLVEVARAIDRGCLRRWRNNLDADSRQRVVQAIAEFFQVPR